MINLSSHKAFSIYLLFAALFLGVQMFQGLSYLDIGMYMSGYQHFTSDPYASYFLGQWILTYDVIHIHKEHHHRTAHRHACPLRQLHGDKL